LDFQYGIIIPTKGADNIVPRGTGLPIAMEWSFLVQDSTDPVKHRVPDVEYIGIYHVLQQPIDAFVTCTIQLWMTDIKNSADQR